MSTQQPIGGWHNANERGYTVQPVRLKGDLPGQENSRSATVKPAARLIARDGDRSPDALFLLGRRARLKILDMRGDAEDGGWLLGPRRQTWRLNECTESIWRANESDRGSERMTIHLAELDQIMEDRGYKDDVVVGHWHSQPNSSDPSPQDMESWRWLFTHLNDRYGIEAFTGVVVADRITGHLDIKAYTYSRDDDGEICYRVGDIHARS